MRSPDRSSSDGACGYDGYDGFDVSHQDARQTWACRVAAMTMTDNMAMTISRVLHKTALHQAGGKAPGDLQYWLSQPVQARIAAVEELRRQVAGYDAEPRLQRVCRITRLKQG